MHKHDKQKKNPETGHTALVKRTNCDISETALPITETKKTKTLCNTKYPSEPGKTHLRNSFWPIESGFSAIATYKMHVFSNPAMS